MIETKLRSEQMAADLTGQETRGMTNYAREGVPSEAWGAEFHRKLRMWQAELAAYERQELAEFARPASQPGGE
jgi:hypothetical protein